MTIAKHNPEYFEWTTKMEDQYEDYKPENKPKFPVPARFFRKYLTSKEIIEMSKADFDEASDDRLIFTKNCQLSLDLDLSDGCESGCEAFL